jgi:hypothetical protein
MAKGPAKVGSWMPLTVVRRAKQFIFIRNHAAHFETFAVTKALVTAVPPPNAFFDHDWAI